MKIGLLADTHSKEEHTRFVVKTFKKEGVDFIIHAGDIVKEENLKTLKKSKIPYVAVLGNNDDDLKHLTKEYNLVKEPHTFTLKNLKIKLMHHPYYLKADANLIVYGHTHYFDAKINKSSFFVNPGEVCGRKTGYCECAIVEFKKDKWHLKYFKSKLKKYDWESKEKSFKI